MKELHIVRRLSQWLFVSVSLNLGLLSMMAYHSWQERFTTPSVPSTLTVQRPVLELARYFAAMSPEALFQRLDTRRSVDDTLTQRDLALACLVHHHTFDLSRALGQEVLPSRTLPLEPPLPLYTELTENQWEKLTHFAATEEWPYTPEGLFAYLQQPDPPRSLIEAFAYTLPRLKHLSSDALVSLVREHTDWDTFQKLLSAEVYTVQKGDSLWKIAHAHNIPLQDLIDANHIAGDHLSPGTTIRIP